MMPLPKPALAHSAATDAVDIGLQLGDSVDDFAFGFADVEHGLQPEEPKPSQPSQPPSDPSQKPPAPAVPSPKGKAKGAPKPKPPPKLIQRVCQLCQVDTTEWGAGKNHCVPCMQAYDAADRHNKEKQDRAAWQDVRKDITQLREYLHEYVAVHGPGQGSGKRRGRLQRCLLPIWKANRVEQQTKKEFEATMVRRGQTQDHSESDDRTVRSELQSFSTLP